MANPEVATPMKSEFLEKVGEIPIANSAKEYGSALYNQVKGMNTFTATALSVAEASVLYAIFAAKPFLEKVEPQVKVIDQMACKGIVAVEEKAPFLKLTPEELVSEARKLASSTYDLANQKVEDIKTYGTDTITSVKNYGVDKVTEALKGTEVFVDKYIPAPFGDGQTEANSTSDSEKSSVQERASKLTNKIGLRLYGHGIKHIMPIHNLGEESASKLSYTLALLIQLKENISNKSIQDYVDEAKVKASWIWEELNKEPAEVKDDAQKSLEQRALSLARRTTSVLVHAYNALPLPSVPKSYQEGVEKARTCASELFISLDQTTNAGDITIKWLQSVKEKVDSLQEVIKSLKTEEIQMEEIQKSESTDHVPETPKSPEK